MAYFKNIKQVAVKTLRIGLENEFMDEFQKEIEIFCDLQHPNIASLKVSVVTFNMLQYNNTVLFY